MWVLVMVFMVLCSNCSTENPDGAKFCSNCGTALNSVSDISVSDVPNGGKGDKSPLRSTDQRYRNVYRMCLMGEKATKNPSKVRRFVGWIGSILGWIYGVVFTILGVSLISEGNITGLFAMVGGIILIPLARDCIANITKTNRITGSMALVICILFMVVGMSISPGPTTNDGTSNADMATRQENPNVDAELITKSEEEMLLTIDDMPLGWTGSNGAFKYIQSGDFRSVESEVTKYSSVDEAKEAYQNLIPENVATTSVNFGDEGVGYIKTMGSWTCIIFRKDNVIVEIRGFSQYHTIDMTDIKMLAMAVEKKM